MNYKIAVKTETKKKPYNTSLHLIVGFTMMGIGAFSLLLGQSNWVQQVFHQPLISVKTLGTWALVYGFIILMLVFFAGKSLKDKKRNRQLRAAHIIDSVLLGVVFLLSQWWLAAALCGVLALLTLVAIYVEQKMSETLWVQITEEKIVLPAISRRKQLLWQEVDRLIIRHGNITIDTVDNFLFQWPLVDSIAEAEAIEAYSAARIHAHKDQRQKDDW